MVKLKNLPEFKEEVAQKSTGFNWQKANDVFSGLNILNLKICAKKGKLHTFWAQNSQRTGSLLIQNIERLAEYLQKYRNRLTWPKVTKFRADTSISRSEHLPGVGREHRGHRSVAEKGQKPQQKELQQQHEWLSQNEVNKVPAKQDDGGSSSRGKVYHCLPEALKYPGSLGQVHIPYLGTFSHSTKIIASSQTFLNVLKSCDQMLFLLRKTPMS